MTHSGLYIVCGHHCRSPNANQRLAPGEVAEFNDDATTNPTGLHPTVSFGCLLHLQHIGHPQRQRAVFNLLPELIELIATSVIVAHPDRVQGHAAFALAFIPADRDDLRAVFGGRDDLIHLAGSIYDPVDAFRELRTYRLGKAFATEFDDIGTELLD